MRLTSLQRRTLELYRKFRITPPTLGCLLLMSLPNHVVLLLIFSVAAFLYKEFQFPAGLALGTALGGILRDIGTFRRLSQIWPVLSQVFDWKKIDECLELDAYTAEYPEEL